jgi:hypothetical protein
MSAPLRTDLNDFLHAPIAQDANGISLTVLSVLARSGVDPWAEAAELADLSRDSATEKLISLLAGVPNGPSPGADTVTLASRLVTLLHPSRKPRPPAPGAATPTAAVEEQLRRVNRPIYYLLALIFVLVGYCAMTSRDAPTPTDSSPALTR